MKKYFSVTLLCLSFLLAFTHIALAEHTNWWGTYCNESNNTCLSINNLDVSPMGPIFFIGTFYDTNNNEVCSMTAITESLESRVADFGGYSYTITEDNNLINIGQMADFELLQEDGCTAALFGEYVRE